MNTNDTNHQHGSKYSTDDMKKTGKQNTPGQKQDMNPNRTKENDTKRQAEYNPNRQR